MNAPAAMGHNNPPDPLDEATAPYAAAIEEAENWLDGSAVESAAQMQAVDALLRDVKAAEKAVKAAEEAEAKPLHEAWKAAKARFKPTLDDMGRIKAGLVKLVDGFKRKEAERIAAEQRAARAAAEKAARAAAAAAAEADQANIEAVRLAAEKQRAAEEAQAEAAAASRQKIKGMRTVQRHEIEDMRLALHWIARNDKDAVAAFVTEYVRRNFRDAAIEGVRVWSEKEAF